MGARADDWTGILYCCGSSVSAGSLRPWESCMKVSDIICDHDFNCRGQVFPDECQDLAASIKEVGLLNPITVMACGDKWKIVAGHRRYTAVVSLGWETVEVNIVDVTEQEAMMINLQENIGRKDLTPTQEMRSIIRIYGERPDVAQVASDLGKGRTWVRERLAIRTLPEEVQKSIDQRELSIGDISYLITVPYDERWSVAKMLIERRKQGKANTGFVQKLKKAYKPKPKRHYQAAIRVLQTTGKEPTWEDVLNWCVGELSSEGLFGLPLDELKKYGILE